MNAKNIDKIRDVATFLRGSDDKASFKLFGLARAYRPFGPYILNSYNELKKKLGIKTFVVIGNCQAKVISNLLEEKNTKFIVEKTIIAHHYKKHDPTINYYLNNVDYIITQNLNDNFIDISTRSILNKYKGKTIRVLNLHYLGYHPDWCFLPVVNGNRCQSLLMDYHNKTILKAFIDRKSEEEAFDLYNDLDFNYTEYNNEDKKSILELKARENNVDIKMSHVIEDLYERGDVSFHTFNHPNRDLINIQVNKILERINIDEFLSSTCGESLDNIIIRTNPIFKGSPVSKLTRNNKNVDIIDFITQSYITYSQSDDSIQAYKNINL